MKSKYRSKKVIVAGQKFDSKKEYQRWKELQLLEKAGKITNLRRQVKFRILPSQYVQEPTENGYKDVCAERPVTYIADFVYEAPTHHQYMDEQGHLHFSDSWETVVEDAKGFRTADYILKRKLMLFFYGIRIKEI